MRIQPTLQDPSSTVAAKIHSGETTGSSNFNLMTKKISRYGKTTGPIQRLHPPTKSLVLTLQPLPSYLW